MQFFVIAALVASVLAVPADLAPRHWDVCSGLESSPQCCATDILGIACLDSHVPEGPINDAERFRKTCADRGQEARCCLLDVAEQAILCHKV